MITLSTYQNLIEKVGINRLDDANRDAYNIVKDGSSNFTDPSLWNEMLADADIRDTYELHVKALQKMADGSPAPTKKETPKQKAIRKAKTKKTKQVIEMYKQDEPVKTTKAPKKKAAKAKKAKPAKKKSAKAVPKKVAAKAKNEAKFPVTVKRFSKELQLIKRMAAMDGKTKTVKALTSLHRELEKVKKNSPDRKGIINDIYNRISGAIAKATKAGVTELKISLDKDFKERLVSNARNAKPKMKVEYLAGVEANEEKKK